MSLEMRRDTLGGAMSKGPGPPTLELTPAALGAGRIEPARDDAAYVFHGILLCSDNGAWVSRPICGSMS